MSEKKPVARNYTDGQYWEAFKRMLESRWMSPDGVPTLNSSDLVRPQKIAVYISAGAKWTRLYINRAVYLWSSDGRRVDYVSGHHPGDVSAASPSPWNSSVTGVCKLYAPGEWHVKTPLIAGDVEATKHPFIMSDAALGTDTNVSAAEIAGATAIGDSVNIKSIGGTAQTGLDLTGRFAPLSFAGIDPVTVSVTDDNTVVRIAARTGRRFLWAENMGSNDAWVAFASGKAGVNKGILIPKNSVSRPMLMGALDGITEGAIYIACDTGLTTSLAVQEGI